MCSGLLTLQFIFVWSAILVLTIMLVSASGSGLHLPLVIHFFILGFTVYSFVNVINPQIPCA